MVVGMRVGALGLLLLLACSTGAKPPRVAEPERADLPRPRTVPDASGVDVAGPGRCGESGRACCSGNLCAAGGCCVDGRCVEGGAACLVVEGICQQGSCGDGRCGGVDQPCCARGSCTAAGSVCAGGRCEGCGGYGQDVLPRARGVAPGTRLRPRGRGFPCGEPGQTCSAASAGRGLLQRRPLCGGRDELRGRGAVRGWPVRSLREARSGLLPRRPPAPLRGRRRGLRFRDRDLRLAVRRRRSALLPRRSLRRGLSCRSTAAGGGSPAMRVCRPCGGAGQACCPAVPGAAACADGGCCVSGLCLAPAAPARPRRERGAPAWRAAAWGVVRSVRAAA